MISVWPCLQQACCNKQEICSSKISAEKPLKYMVLTKLSIMSLDRYKFNIDISKQGGGGQRTELTTILILTTIADLTMLVIVQLKSQSPELFRQFWSFLE